MKKNEKKYKVFNNFIYITKFIIAYFYIALIFTNIKHFDIWSQITDILNNTTEYNRIFVVGQLFLEHHPHALRVLLMYPIYQLSDIFGWNVEFVFNIVVVFFIFMINIILAKILKGLNIRTFFLAGFIFLLFTSLFMHGRIIFSMFGNTLILYALYKKTYDFSKSIHSFKFMILIIFALWFSSVSSGTFMVSIGTLIVFYFIQIFIEFPYIKKEYIVLSFIILFLLFLLSPIIVQYLNKNLLFFNGSFLHMLNHGIGKYLFKYIYIIMIYILILPFLMIKLIYIFKNKKHYILPFSMMFSSFGVGQFGLSSFISGLPAYILFMYMVFSTKHIRG